MKKLIKASLIVFTILIISYFPIFFQSKTFFFADNYSLLVPQKIWVANQIKEGAMPFWNPHVLSGFPAWADTSYTILYPTTLLFMYLPVHTAVNITLISHLFLAGLGIFYLAKSLKATDSQATLSVVLLILSQFITALTNNMVLLQTFAWTPWMAFLIISWSKEQRRIIAWIVPSVVILSFLSGHPQPLLYVLVLMAAFIIFHPKKLLKKFLQHFFVPIILTVGSTLLFSIPFFELAQLSTRTEMTATDALFGSLNPLYIIQWFIPNFFSNPTAGMAWGPDWTYMSSVVGYVGLLPLLSLVIFTLKSEKTYAQKFFLAVGMIGLIFSFGKYLPGALFVANHIPFLTILRGPALILMIWVISASLLVPFSIQFTQKQAEVHKKLIIILLLLWIALLMGWITRDIWFQKAWNLLDILMKGLLSGSAFHTLKKDKVIFTLIGKQALLTLFFFIASLFVIVKKKMSFIFIVLIVATDLLFAAKPIMLFAKNMVYTIQSEPPRWINENKTDQYRVLSMSGHIPYTGLPSYWHDVIHQPPFAESRYTDEEEQEFKELLARQQTLAPNWNLPHSISSPDGYSTFVLQSVAEYWDDSGENAQINNIHHPSLEDERWRQQGAKYFIYNKLLFTKLPKQLSNFDIVKEEKDWIIFENKQAMPLVRTSQDGVKIDNVRIRANTVSFSFQSSKTSDVLVHQNYYPGWSCEISEASCDIKPGSDLNMIISMPPGNHQVSMRFKPKHWNTLLLISSTSLFVYAVAGLFLARQEQISHI